MLKTLLKNTHHCSLCPTGRLKFSTVDGRSTQDTSKFERLYFYGARSVTVFRADDFSLVYDTGDEIERKHAVFYPNIFNADYDSDDPDTETVEDTFDKRSDARVCKYRISHFGMSVAHVCYC